MRGLHFLHRIVRNLTVLLVLSLMVAGPIGAQQTVERISRSDESPVRRDAHFDAARDLGRTNNMSVPILMYYYQRHLEGMPPEDDAARILARLLAEDPEAIPPIRRAVERWREMSLETKIEVFHPEIVAMTADIRRPLNIDEVRHWLSTKMPNLKTEIPTAPSGLTATSASKPPNPDISGSEKYQIALSWTDNSISEDGFAVYRVAKPAVGQQGAASIVATLGSNTTSYIDKLPVPQNQKDTFCYRVVAFQGAKIALAGTVPLKSYSAPSNSSCSLYDYTLGLPPPLPDTDKDGIADAGDECPSQYGSYPSGCPDLDKDGYADKDDDCPLVWGDTPVPGDTGPKPLDGCPFRYSLRLMKMTVLNNSVDAHKPPNFHYNEMNAVNDTPGEEPYLLFGFINGQIQGIPNSATSRWCCGEKVDVAAGDNYEPDTDYSGEEAPGVIASLKIGAGVKAFPVAAVTHETIDRELGLAMVVTLMEQDKSAKVTSAANELEMSKALGTGSAVLGTVFGCAASGGTFGCLLGVANAMKSVIEFTFGAIQTPPAPVTVDDPDDFMGTNAWAIDRVSAKFRTTNTGVYPFYLIELPTKQWTLCSVVPCGVGWGKMATMRVRLDFCLVREGIAESKVKQLCSAPQAVVPWPMSP